MWDTVANIFWNIYSRWADRSVVRISVKHLKYQSLSNDPNSIVIVATSVPSRYYSVIKFAHRGKPTTIKALNLIIDDALELEATGFSPLKLEHGDYHEMVVTFPVEEKVAVKRGNFKMQAIGAFDKVVHLCRGRFPIG